MTSAIHKPRFTIILATVILASTVAACEGSHDVNSPRIQSPSFDRAPDATEVTYYNGAVYRFQFPSSGSNNQNELLILDCNFRVGPDFTSHAHNESTTTLYALFLPGAAQHACPDGTNVHDHILSAVPGSPGYSTLWGLKAVVPGPSFVQSIMPITSEPALLNAEALGQVVIVDTGLLLKAVVIGPRS